MANHLSAKKRIRQNGVRRLHNRYYARTTRNAVRQLQATTDKATAEDMMPKVIAMVDKLARKNQIHKNKAAHLKSKIAKHVNALS